MTCSSVLHSWSKRKHEERTPNSLAVLPPAKEPAPWGTVHWTARPSCPKQSTATPFGLVSKFAKRRLVQCLLPLLSPFLQTAHWRQTFGSTVWKIAPQTRPRYPTTTRAGVSCWSGDEVCSLGRSKRCYSNKTIQHMSQNHSVAYRTLDSTAITRWIWILLDNCTKWKTLALSLSCSKSTFFQPFKDMNV